MAEWSKAPDSRHSLASFIGSIVENSGPRMRAWVQIPLLTKIFLLTIIIQLRFKMSTTSRIPRRSPIQVLTRLDVA